MFGDTPGVDEPGQSDKAEAGEEGCLESWEDMESWEDLDHSESDEVRRWFLYC